MTVMVVMLLLLAFTLLSGNTQAAPDLEKWHGRSVYFVVTDRFARDSDTSSDTTGTTGGSAGLQVCGNGTKEWCGGTFKGVMSKLDYIIGMGFDALWITPVVKQVTWRDHWNGTGYHGAWTWIAQLGNSVRTLCARAGYWASDFHEIDSHLGTEADLQALTAACKKRGMLFMLDVVANHVGKSCPVRKHQPVQVLVQARG